MPVSGRVVDRYRWDEWFLAFKNLFFPIFCRKCGLRLLTEENGYFCPTCWEMSPRIERPFCLICGKPHATMLGRSTDRLFPCAACGTAGFDPPYRQIRGAAYYDDAIADAIKLFKFHRKKRLAEPLAELLAEAARRELDTDSYACVIPVPLHPVRARARGYNQSLLLAQEFSRKLGALPIEQPLRRTRPTRVQSTLTDEAERRANVQGAFAVDPIEHLVGSAVLLIDDVVTSAGTVTECAATLRAAGVRTVDVLAVALAVRAPQTR